MRFYITKQPILSRLFLSPFLLLLFFASVNAADIDVNRLIEVAKKQNKHIMFFHHIPGCPYCKAMLDENFKDATIIKEIEKNFLHVDIYTADDGVITFGAFKGSYKEFSKHIGASAYPATIFMNSVGKTVFKSIGYRNIDEYLLELSYVSSKSYKTMDLEAYSIKKEME